MLNHFSLLIIIAFILIDFSVPAFCKSNDIADCSFEQGVFRIPTGTRIQILMNTALGSEAMKDGSDFSARTAVDMSCTGRIIIPAGSVTKGKIWIKNRPNEGPSYVLQFDAITLPNNPVDCPLVAFLVAKNGTVQVSRRRKSIAIKAKPQLPLEQSTPFIKEQLEHKPMPMCVAFGVLPPKQILLLCNKKTGTVDIQSGDKLVIEIAEDLRIPGPMGTTGTTIQQIELQNSSPRSFAK